VSVRDEEKQLKKDFLAEHKKNQAVLFATKTKPRKMTTEAAVRSGQNVQNARARWKNKSMTKARLDEIIKEEPFKDISVFKEFFGDDWDLIKSIACDPAHELQNLVKDLLALLTDQGNMHFKAKLWRTEKQAGRFQEFSTHYGVPVASWHISNKIKTVLTRLIEANVLKVPEGWPATTSYFSEDYEKIKLAESMAFCGDRGVYYLGLADIEPSIRDDFIELVTVAGYFISKTTTGTSFLYFFLYMYIYI
jgi:hypothetical protein